MTEDSKNLAKVKTRTQKQAAGATTKKPTESLFGKFEYHLLKKGLAKGTIEQRIWLLKGLEKHCNLFDPESVKLAIARMDNWSKGTKRLAVIAYENFASMEGIKFDPPTYRPDGTHPFVPTEQEIDILIAGCGPKLSAFLQLIKETGVRAGEALRLKWTDINPHSKTVRITAEKGSKPRTPRISNKCYAMINSLPRENEKIWAVQLHSVRVNYLRQRKRLAHKLKNPRLRKISFCTLRHWFATNLYHQTRDILFVKNALGHKFVGNTMVYIDLEQAIYGGIQDDNFTVKVAINLSDACQLLEAGFEYVGNMHGHELFRKRK
ncbi:MAG: site-specific integrase [Candidatus Bathyarchaeota archaeon]